jgi:hypothetical protein
MTLSKSLFASFFLVSIGGLSGCDDSSSSADGDASPDATFSRIDDTITLRVGDLSLSIDGRYGARIASFQVKGVETLVQKDDAFQWGTTFWPSPQTWNWPPEGSLGQIDRQPYAITESDEAVTFESQFNSTLGIVVRKTMRPSSSGQIVIEYAIENQGEMPLEVAPWEVSRIGPGVAFYPTGPGGQVEGSTLELTYIEGNSWYDYHAEGLSDVPKNSEDGAEGWLAVAVGGVDADGALVVKSFEDIDVSQFAPEHGEIEIYADPSGDYMEVEQQGAYREIAVGESLLWTVTWDGATIPKGTDLTAGSSALLALAESTL